MAFDLELINAFYGAATNVLGAELGTLVRRGPLELRQSDVVFGELNALIAVTGDYQGYILFELDELLARKLTARMLDQDTLLLKPSLIESAMGELGNMIVGHANAELEEAGRQIRALPPEVITGRNTIIRPRKDTRLRIPIELGLGHFDIEVSEDQKDESDSLGFSQGGAAQT